MYVAIPEFVEQVEPLQEFLEKCIWRVQKK